MRDGAYQWVEDPDDALRASLREPTGETKKLRRAAVKTWLEDAGLHAGNEQSPYHGSSAYRSLDLFLKSGEERVYGLDEQARFMTELVSFSGGKESEKQEDLLKSVAQLGAWIEQKYPPGKFAYVGLGRSPAAIMAYLQSRHPEHTHSIPLSSFRPGPEESDSILNKVLTTESREKKWFGLGRESTVVRPTRPMSERQRAMLDAHFAEFLPKELPGDVVLIDYTQSAQSLVSAQHQLQRYLGKRSAVHALALHEDRHAATIAAVHDAVTEEDDHLLPPSPADLDLLEDRAEARRVWGERFTSRNVGDDTPLAEAFRRELFDAYAPHGSYKLLEQDPESFAENRPRKDRPREPGDVFADEVLGDELSKLG